MRCGCGPGSSAPAAKQLADEWQPVIDTVETAAQGLPCTPEGLVGLTVAAQDAALLAAFVGAGISHTHTHTHTHTCCVGLIVCIL
jgi:hypothetical protein